MPPLTLPPGARLGPYEILSALGAGGMGEVYRARDTRLDRTVAIKVLSAQLAGDKQLRDRFDREARAISSLNHPHICALYDVGEVPVAPSAGVDQSAVSGADPLRFLVLEYIEGETVADRLARSGAIVPGEALRIAIEICDALDRAHRSGIVHRDLKPANVMLTKSGAKLLDFGLAKSGTPVVAASGLSMLPTTPPDLTAQGAILGTFQYMAPEQIEGLEADARTDIFAFGALLFEMLTGRTAFAGKTRASLLGAILKDEPPRVSTVEPIAPPALDRIVSTCLAKDPDDRYQSSRDLLRDLRWAAAGQTAEAVPVAHPPPSARAASRGSSQPFFRSPSSRWGSRLYASPKHLAQSRSPSPLRRLTICCLPDCPVAVLAWPLNWRSHRMGANWSPWQVALTATSYGCGPLGTQGGPQSLEPRTAHFPSGHPTAAPWDSSREAA